MTFLEALYGSQYAEIEKMGKDGNKARFNGNLFLSAFVIVILFCIILLAVTFVPGFGDASNKWLHSIFGYTSGKLIGKLLAIPLLAIIYFVVIKTVGTEESFQGKVSSYMQYSEEVQAKANKKILIPFMAAILLMFVLSVAGL